MKKYILYLFFIIFPLTSLTMDHSEYTVIESSQYTQNQLTVNTSSIEQDGLSIENQLFRSCITTPIKIKNIELYTLFLIEKVKILKQEPNLNNLATIVESFHYTKTHSTFTEEQLGKYLFNKKNNALEIKHSDNLLTSIIISRIGQYFKDIEKDKIPHLTNIMINFNEFNKSLFSDYITIFKKTYLTSLLMLKKYNISDNTKLPTINHHFILAFDIEKLLNLDEKIIEHMAKILYKTDDDISEDLSSSISCS